jgi:PAS domain S-box-containing protein
MDNDQISRDGVAEPSDRGPAHSAGALADLAGLAYFEVDAERNLIAISPALERLTGFSADEMMGRSCLTVIRCSECLKGCGVFRHGDVRDVRLTIYREDGSELEVMKSGKVFRDAAGQITGAIEVVEPVVAAGQGTQGGRAELDVLLQGLGREYVLASERLEVVGHSVGLPAQLGTTPEELRGKPLSELLGRDLFGEDSRLRGAIAAGERREGLRAFLPVAGGTPRPVSLSIGPLDSSDACGGVDGKVIIMIRPEEEADARQVPAFEGIVARSPAMQRIFRVIELLRDNDSTVLVTGESGTGKELVARALHANSHRSAGPFVAVNCAAIPSELLESELFGHARGAFTGAVKDRAGRFELADGGTLFLDEIGDLALNLQAKLLRFLQEHTFERVGETRTRKVDVRVIAATNVNLVRAVAERRFREDLYYRLRVVPIEIPPLRDRREDLELLIRFFLDGIGDERRRALRLAPSASRALLTYPWPGNVRELQNALEYATTVCEGQTIHIRDLPQEVGRHSSEASGRADPWSGSASGAGLDELAASVDALDPAARAGTSQPVRVDSNGRDMASGPDLTPMEAAEAARIREALERARFRRADAARQLGISRTTLWRKMKQYRL